MAESARSSLECTDANHDLTSSMTSSCDAVGDICCPICVPIIGGTMDAASNTDAAGVFVGARAPPAGSGERASESSSSSSSSSPPTTVMCVASGDISRFAGIALPGVVPACVGPAGVTGDPMVSASSILDAVTTGLADDVGLLRFLREPNESDVPGVCPAFSELNDRSIPATTTFGDRGESGVRAPRADRGVSLLTLLAPDAINVMFSMFSVAFAAATSKVGVHDVCDCEFGTMPVLVQSMDLSAGVIMPTSSPFVYTRVFCAVVGGEGHRGSASRGKGDGRGGDPETHSPRHIRFAGVRHSGLGEVGARTHLEVVGPLQAARAAGGAGRARVSQRRLHAHTQRVLPLAHGRAVVRGEIWGVRAKFSWRLNRGKTDEEKPFHQTNDGDTRRSNSPNLPR